MADLPTRNITATGDLGIRHGHLMGCAGGCDLPIHDCATSNAYLALLDERDRLREASGLRDRERVALRAEIERLREERWMTVHARHVLLAVLERFDAEGNRPVYVPPIGGPEGNR